MTRILNRVEYIGKVAKNGIVYENIFPRIISDEQYNRVQELRKTIIRTQYEDHYRFQNRIVCNKCKRFCNKDSSVKNKCNKYYYYHCPECKKYINVNHIEKQLECLIDLKDKIWVDEVMIRSIESKINYYKKRINLLSSDFVDEFIDAEQYNQLQKVIHDKIQELEIELLKHSNVNYKCASRVERKALIESTVDKIFVDFDSKQIDEIVYLKQKK